MDERSSLLLIHQQRRKNVS